jgi:hypothetical protein
LPSSFILSSSLVSGLLNRIGDPIILRGPMDVLVPLDFYRVVWTTIPLRLRHTLKLRRLPTKDGGRAFGLALSWEDLGLTSSKIAKPVIIGERMTGSVTGHIGLQRPAYLASDEVRSQKIEARALPTSGQ